MSCGFQLGDCIMNRLVATRTVMVLCLCVNALVFATSLDGSGKEGPEGIVELERGLEEWLRVFGLDHTSMAAAENKLAEKQYKERGAEITSWTKDASFPNPDNAALLYYQAFLLRPEPNMATSEKIMDVLRGAESDRRIRTYLGHCLPMIRLVETASQIPQCTWGLWNGPEPDFRKYDLVIQMRRLRLILEVDARVLSADGHYRAALARCLTMRRLAQHINDNTTFMRLASISLDATALRTAKHVLGAMSPDVDALMWFRGQLVGIQGAPVTFAEILQAEFEATLYCVRSDPVLLAKLRNQLVEKGKDKQIKESARDLTDEQLVSQIREPYARFLNSVVGIIGKDMSYKQKYTQMRALTDKLMEEYVSDPVVDPVILRCDPETRVDEMYPRLIGHAALCNGLGAAFEIYLIVAETGRLPEKLPEYLPKDPFTGRDFVYEITDEGFALRCQGEEFLSGKSRWLEFKVRR